MGSDATVVYGDKDLRLPNHQAQPLHIRFELGDTQVSASLGAQHPIPRWDVCLPKPELVSHTFYQRSC